MIEPTESESKARLTACDAMIAIAPRFKDRNGSVNPENNPLMLAPHTLDDIIGDWDRPYTREGLLPGGKPREIVLVAGQPYRPSLRRPAFGLLYPPLEAYQDAAEA